MGSATSAPSSSRISASPRHAAASSKAYRWGSGGPAGSRPGRRGEGAAGAGGVGAPRHYFRVPAEFGEAQPKSTQTSAVVGSLFWLGVALALGFAIARSRAGDVRWRPAIALTVAAAGGTAVFQGANVVAAELYDHPAAQSVALFWVGPLVKLLFPTVFFGGVMLLSIAAGE